MKGHINKIAVAVTLLLIVSFFGGCGASPKGSISKSKSVEFSDVQSSQASSSSRSTATSSSTSSTQPTGTNIYGNTPGNIINGGFAAQQGNWIYYQNTVNGTVLYKVMGNGKGGMLLCNTVPNNINVVGDWVYFSDPSKGGIYKVTTDGSGLSLISDSKVTPTSMIVVGDWIYYNDEGNNNFLYKMKTDGTGKTQLTSVIANCINVDGDWIYFENDNDHQTIYKIKTDGSDLTKVCSDSTEDMVVSNDWIYYNTIWTSSDSMYKIETDGTSRTRLLTKDVYQINVVGDSIYYLSGDSVDNLNLYSMSLDGQNNKQIGSFIVKNYNIVLNQIFYWDNQGAMHSWSN